MRHAVGPSLLAALVCLQGTWWANADYHDVPVVKGRQILIYGKPFHVRGVCYSPVPINESMLFGPYGDYFTDEYAFLWRRDLPLIKSMGANAIRIYGWDDDADHDLFLNTVLKYGLRVLITMPLGNAATTPIRGDMNRMKVARKFERQVAKYGEHAAILAWSFGNEINMKEHGFLQELDREFVCGWNVHDEANGGCFNPKNPPNSSNPCYDSSYCVYDKLFKWINLAARAAKRHSQVPILTAFADVDQVLDKIERAGHIMDAVDIWALQLYRGYSFGSWFKKAHNASHSRTNHKAFLITEYGVDAYHDVCGHDPHKTPCFNQLGDTSGSHEDEGTQAVWDRNLTLEIEWYSSAQPMCAKGTPEYERIVNVTGDTSFVEQTCVVAGGFVYSWVDEFWKGSYVAAECHPNFWEPAFTIDKCEYKAHVTCANWNASVHDLCGQPLPTSPDKYQNEEWFGITSPVKCADSIDGLRLRKVYWALREEWTGGLNNDSITLPSCANVASCPGNCSGHGECVTSHLVCGPATSDPDTGAPCCKCYTGWAGPSCDMLDARTKLSLGAGFSFVLLLAGVLLSYGLRSNNTGPPSHQKSGSRQLPKSNGDGIEQSLLIDQKLIQSGGHAPQ